MRRTLVAIPIAALSLVGWSTLPATAQGTKTARGTVTSIANDSVTVKVGAQDMKFSVDGQTTVEATGAGTRTRQAQAAGAAGVKVGDLLRTGQAVEVSYSETGGAMRATRIRAVSSAGGGGSGSADTPAAPAAKRASGTVKSVAAGSLTISSGGKDSTFAIDSSTQVQGRGAGTAARRGGGRVPITDLVASGDTVTVTYHDAGGAMHASDVRVTVKAVK